MWLRSLAYGPLVQALCKNKNTWENTLFFNLTDIDEIDENAEEMTSLNGNYF